MSKCQVRHLMRQLSTRAGLDNPHPTYGELRAAAPMHDAPHFGPVLTRYLDVRSVLFDRELKVSSAAAQPRSARANIAARLPHDLAALPAPLFLQDDPSHKRLRKLIVPSFSHSAILAQRPFIEATAQALIDKIEDQHSADIIASLAVPLPTAVIARILGVPHSAMHEFRTWSEDIVHELHALAPAEELTRAIAAHRALVGFFRAELALRLKRPRNDLISRLALAMRDDKALSEDEIVSLCVNVLVAGHITTCDLIGILTYLLLTHREERQKLDADPALWPQAVEEALRFDPPTPMLARVHARPGERYGKQFEPGDSINVFIASANRDPSLFEHADRFDVSREDNPHLSFGGGVHYCLGAQLARAEAEIAVRTLFERLPRLALAEAGATWRHTPNFRGLARLGVINTRAPAATRTAFAEALA